MPSNLTILFLLVFVFAVCLSQNGVYAFGAGNIPSFAYMEGKAFRHGDIEDALGQLMKKGAGGALAMFSKGSKWGGLDIKRVYFGNWLRDYSQAVDIGGLKKVQLQTIINLLMALGFLAHGYATQEFEVTEERLGVYLPTEHIDNPKGYGEGEDARKYHPKLRGPVDPMELQIDPETGMKNYIANERGHWDTSKALVRRTIEHCIHLGRQHRAQGRKQDEYEAYRLLGQALHTLEDFAAHSNFCELTLVSMGYTDVFVHVGDHVRIPVRGNHHRMVAPIVTGTFGSSDFIHSLLGEATDHISEASVTDLNKAMDKARSQASSGTRGGPMTDPADTLRDLLFKLPVGGGDMAREMEGVQRIRAGPTQGGKRPEDMSPQELHSVMWQVLTFRDSVVKKIEKTIENIPGLSSVIEKLMDSIGVFVLTTLEPFLKPILQTATSGLQTASSEVINNYDQYEVFNDPMASDPTHSFLSKDHFNLILNEPAGNVSKIILMHAVPLIVKAWDDNTVNVRAVTEDILQCLFHPDFHDPNSKIQREMLQYMRTWVQSLGNKQHETLRRLTKQAVRNHENTRSTGDGGPPSSQGSFAANQAGHVQSAIHGYVQQVPGVSLVGNFSGPRRDIPGEPGRSATMPGYPGSPGGLHSHNVPSGGLGSHNAPSGAPGSYGAPPGALASYNTPSGGPGLHNVPSGAPGSYNAPPASYNTPPASYNAPPASYNAPSGVPGSHNAPLGTTNFAPSPPHSTTPAPSYFPEQPSYAPSNAPSFPGNPPHTQQYTAAPGPPSFPGGPLEQGSHTPAYNTPPPSFGMPAGSGPVFPAQPSPGYDNPHSYGGGPGGFGAPSGPQRAYTVPVGGYDAPSAGFPPAPGAPAGFGSPPGGYNSSPTFPGSDTYGSPPPQFPGGPGAPASGYPSGSYQYGGGSQSGYM